MVSAFGSGKPAKSERWITVFPRFDRGNLARLGALDPGKRTQWVVKDPRNPTGALFIELVAAVDRLTIVTGHRVQVVRYHYDSALPHGGLRQFFVCCGLEVLAPPRSCERICRTLYFDQHWGCRTCLNLRYPTDSTPASRVLAVHQIADLKRGLLETRPGSRRWKDLLAQIAQRHAILTADVARVRRDLWRRLKNDYRR
jgi:hypothetical protein